MVAKIGDQLGDYRLARELGTGTFGTVYQAEHVLLGTQVAIKVLHGQISDAERQKLRAEARNQATLEHPNILPVLGYSEQPAPFLVMRFALYGTFKERYLLGQRFLLTSVLQHIRQIAEGLQYAHDRHTLHLDLKPANVLLGSSQEALISDFGLAVILQEHRTHQTMSGFAGTPAFAAPEQFANKPGKASDQYALATMVYQWLTGTLPFVGDVWSMGMQKLTSDPTPLRNYVPDTPPAVEEMVLRALAKEPIARYPSVLDFAKALEAAAQPPLVLNPVPQFSSPKTSPAPQPVPAWPSQTPLPVNYGAPPTRGGGFNLSVLWKKLGLTGMVAFICGLFLFLSFFLSWFSVDNGTIESLSGASVATSEFRPVGLTHLLWLIPLAGLTLVALSMLRALGKLPSGWVNLGVLFSAGAALLCEIIFFSLASTYFGTSAAVLPGVNFGPAFGFYLAVGLTLLVCGVVVYFGFIKRQV